MTYLYDGTCIQQCACCSLVLFGLYSLFMVVYYSVERLTGYFPPIMADDS